MSIFLEIVQILLTTKMDELRNNSLEADHSYFNQTRTAVGYGRNEVVANAKRRCIEILQKDLAELKYTISDRNTCNLIHNMISLCIINMQTARQISFFSETDTDRKIRELAVVLDEIYNKLSALGVLDTEHNTDPLAIFQYHIAYYCAKKIVDNTYAGWIDKLTAHPWITQTNKIAVKKDQFIFQHQESINDEDVTGIIPICIKKLQRLADKYAQNIDSRKSVVLEHILQIQLINQEFYTLNRVNPLEPATTSFMNRIYDAMVMTQNYYGLLGICLVEAAQEIRHNTAAELEFEQYTTDHPVEVSNALSK